MRPFPIFRSFGLAAAFLATGHFVAADDAAPTPAPDRVLKPGDLSPETWPVSPDSKPLDPDLERFTAPQHDAGTGSESAFISPEIGEPEDPVTRTARQKYVQAALLATTSNPSRALDLFREASEKDPENRWLALRAIDQAILLNDLAYAEERSRALLRQDAENHQAMLRLAKVASGRGRQQDAARWARAALELQPNNLDALSILAELSHVAGNYEDLKEYTGRILKVSRLNLQALLWNADANALTGNVKEAAQLYERVLRYRPSLIGNLNDMARRLLNIGREDDALQLFQAGITIMPEENSVRRGWESILMRRGGETAVREGYQKLIAEANRDVKIMELYAEYLSRMEDVEGLRELRLDILKEEPKHIGSIMDLARLALKSGNHEEASGFLQRAMEAGPDDPRVFRSIGQIYLMQGDPVKAETALMSAIAIDPEDAPSLGLLAELAERRGDIRRAERLFRRAIDSAPAEPVFLRGLAEFFLRHARKSEAIDLLSAVLAAAPGDTATRLQLARMHYESGDLKKIEMLVDPVRANEPNGAEFLFEAGVLAQEWGDFERSRRCLERVVEAIPAHIPARFRLARTLLFLERPELADAMVAEAGKRVDASPRMQMQYQALLAGYHQDRGNAEGREAALRGLLALDETNLEFRLQLATFLAEQGRMEEGRPLIEEAPRDDSPESTRAQRLATARFLQAGGEHRAALDELRTLLETAPDDPEVLFQAAFVAGDAGEIQAAETWYRRLKDVVGEKDAAGNVPYYRVLAANNLAFTLAKRGERLEEALELGEMALSWDPKAPFILDTVGYTKMRLGRLQESKPLLERAAKLSLRDPEIFFHLGEVNRQLGNAAEAVRYYDRALAIDPTLTEAAERRAEVTREAAQKRNDEPATIKSE